MILSVKMNFEEEATRIANKNKVRIKPETIKDYLNSETVKELSNNYMIPLEPPPTSASALNYNLMKYITYKLEDVYAFGCIKSIDDEQAIFEFNIHKAPFEIAVQSHISNNNFHIRIVLHNLLVKFNQDDRFCERIASAKFGLNIFNNGRLFVIDKE